MVYYYRKVHSQLCSILLGLGQPTSHMWLTVTLSMKAIVEWQDARLDVNRSNDKTTEEKYVFDSDLFLKFDQKFLEPEV